MSWAVGYDSRGGRDIGYGVPAYCDHPGCNEVIDRGLSYVCGGEPYGGEEGCGLYFCAHHLYMNTGIQLCKQCLDGNAPFSPTQDHQKWNTWKLTDQSWQQWREENPVEAWKLHPLYQWAKRKTGNR